MNITLDESPSVKPPTRSEHCRELYRSGIRDKKELAERTGLSAAGVWHALKTASAYHPADYTADEIARPTIQEYERAYALATARGSARDRATEIAKEFAAIRVLASRR